METAVKVLIVGGVLNLGYGALTGVIISNVRRRNSEANRFLTLAHIGPFMQGPMLLGLAVATGLSSLSDGLETIAAWLLVVGSAGIAAGDTLHWLTGTTDPFAERPVGFYLQAVGGVTMALGIGIFTVGVFRGL